MNLKQKRAKRNEYMRKYRLSHLELERERDRVRRAKPHRIAWREWWDSQPKNRKTARARAALWYKRNKNKAWITKRRFGLRQKFGITLEDYERMFRKQRGRCGICNRHAKTFTKSLAVDHCHKTGKIRGLLCGMCNSFLGRIHDDPKPIIKYFGLD